VAVKLPSFFTQITHAKHERIKEKTLRVGCAVANFLGLRNKLGGYDNNISGLSLLCNSDLSTDFASAGLTRRRPKIVHDSDSVVRYENNTSIIKAAFFDVITHIFVEVDCAHFRRAVPCGRSRTRANASDCACPSCA
jgi:hypothetical protein